MKKATVPLPDFVRLHLRHTPQCVTQVGRAHKILKRLITGCDIHYLVRGMANLPQ